MPTKRRKLSARPVGISERALEAWRTGDFHGLNRALGVMPFDPSPFDVSGPECPACYATRAPGDAMSPWRWERAWELRTALLELAGPPGRFDRHGEPLGR